MRNYRYIDPRVLHVSRGTKHNLIDTRVEIKKLLENLGFSTSSSSTDLSLGLPLQYLRMTEDGTDYEWVDLFVDRNSLETSSSGNTKLSAYIQRDNYTANIDEYAGTASLEIDLLNPLDATPTVDADTTISVELFDTDGNRVVGGAWQYNATTDIAATAPNATAVATNDYGASSDITDVNGDALTITGWSDVQSHFTASFDVTTHKFSFVWAKSSFAYENKLYTTAGDNFVPGFFNYTMVVSIQEGSNMSSDTIFIPQMGHADPGIRYTFAHFSDGSTNPMLLYPTGAYVAIGDPTNSPESIVHLLGGGGTDGTSANLTDGTQLKVTPETMYFTGGGWDTVTAAVNVGLRYDLHPFILTAQAAWAGTQTGNTSAWYFKPNAAYNADIFARNFDVEEVAPDPFSGDTISAQHVGAVFDTVETGVGGRANLFFQDQASECYYMEFDGANWNNITTAKGEAFTIQGTYLSDFYRVDASTFVLVSRSGNTGNVGFDLYEYNSGNVGNISSYTRTTISVTGSFSKGIWEIGTTSNGKPTFYTINQKNGHPVQFEYNGASYVKTEGNSLYTDVSDETFYGGELQSVSVINNETNDHKVIYSRGRKAFNRDSYAPLFFAMDGRHITTGNTVGSWRRQDNITIGRPTRFF